jgi:hypothetical protein
MVAPHPGGPAREESVGNLSNGMLVLGLAAFGRLTTDIDARTGTMLLFGLCHGTKDSSVYRLPPGAAPSCHLLTWPLLCQVSFLLYPGAPGAGLLSDKQMLTIDTGLKMMSGNLSADERAAVVQQIKDANAASEAKIHDFFGNDATYATYQDYVVQQPVRAQVTALGTSLANAGQPMTAEQSNALATVMSDASKNVIFSGNFTDPTNTDPQTIMNGPAMDTYFQEQAQLQNQIADRAATFLSPEQVAALRQAQTTRLEQTRKSMEMARQVMSGK